MASAGAGAGAGAGRNSSSSSSGKVVLTTHMMSPSPAGAGGMQQHQGPPKQQAVAGIFSNLEQFMMTQAQSYQSVVKALCDRIDGLQQVNEVSTSRIEILEREVENLAHNIKGAPRKPKDPTGGRQLERHSRAHPGNPTVLRRFRLAVRKVIWRNRMQKASYLDVRVEVEDCIASRVERLEQSVHQHVAERSVLREVNRKLEAALSTAPSHKTLLRTMEICLHALDSGSIAASGEVAVHASKDLFLRDRDAIINALSNLLTSINDADSMREPPHVLSGLRPDRWKELQELPLSLTDALQGLRRATVACKKRPGNALTQGMLDLDPDTADAMKLLKRDVGSVYMGLQDDLADVFGMSGEAETLFGEEEQEQLELLFNVVQHAHTSLAAHDACMTAHALATASAARFKDAISAAVKASNASGGSSQEEVDALATRVRDLAGTAETAKATANQTQREFSIVQERVTQLENGAGIASTTTANLSQKVNDLQDSLHNSMDTIEGSEKLVKEGMAEVKGTVDELKKAVDKSTRQVEQLRALNKRKADKDQTVKAVTMLSNAVSELEARVDPAMEEVASMRQQLVEKQDRAEAESEHARMNKDLKKLNVRTAELAASEQPGMARRTASTRCLSCNRPLRQPVPYSRAMDETLPKRPQSAYSDSFHSSPRRRSRSKSPPRQKYPLRPPSAPQQRRSGLVCAAGHLSEEADQHMRAQRRPHSAMPYTRTPYYPDTGHTRKEDGQFQGLDMDTMPRNTGSPSGFVGRKLGEIHRSAVVYSSGDQLPAPGDGEDAGGLLTPSPGPETPSPRHYQHDDHDHDHDHHHHHSHDDQHYGTYTHARHGTGSELARRAQSPQRQASPVTTSQSHAQAQAQAQAAQAQAQAHLSASQSARRRPASAQPASRGMRRSRSEASAKLTHAVPPELMARQGGAQHSHHSKSRSQRRRNTAAPLAPVGAGAGAGGSGGPPGASGPPSVVTYQRMMPRPSSGRASKRT